MDKTIYTLLQEGGPGHLFYARVLTAKAKAMNKGDTLYGFFADPGEASQEVKAAYGCDATYLSIEMFEQVIYRGGSKQIIGKAVSYLRALGFLQPTVDEVYQTVKETYPNSDITPRDIAMWLQESEISK